MKNSTLLLLAGLGAVAAFFYFRKPSGNAKALVPQTPNTGTAKRPVDYLPQIISTATPYIPDNTGQLITAAGNAFTGLWNTLGGTFFKTQTGSQASGVGLGSGYTYTMDDYSAEFGGVYEV